MIKIIGSPDSIFGYFELPELYTPDNSYTPRVAMVGPFPLRIPPPDSEWHTMENLGLIITNHDLSFIEKEKSRKRWKAVYHGKADGTLLSKCTADYPCPYLGSMSFSWHIWTPSGISEEPSYAGLSDSNGQLVYGDLSQPPPVGGPWPVRELVNRSDIIVAELGYAFPGWQANPWNPLFVDPEDQWVARESDNISILSNASLLKETIYEHHGFPTPSDLSPVWLLPGYGHLNYGFATRSKITMTGMINYGDHVDVSVRFSKLVFGTGDWTPPVTSYEVFESVVTLIMATGVPAAPPDYSMQLMTRNLYGSIEQSSDHKVMSSTRRKVRTQALINIEDTLDMNNLENISGLKGAADIVKTLIEGYKAVKNLNPREALKALSGAYLWYKFALQPTVKDAGKLRSDGTKVLKRIQNPDAAKSRRRHSVLFELPPGRHTKVLQVRLSAELILQRNTDLESRIFDALDSIGLLPSPGNLWELVPMSFVVDWFLNIGSVFESLRAERDTWHYTLLQRVESQRYQFLWSRESLDYVFGKGFTPLSSVNGSLYRRSVYTTWGSTDPMLLYGDGGPNIGQWITGGVLVLQKGLS